MESCNRVLFHRRQSLSKVLGHIKILAKILLNLRPPRPLFNVESWLPQFVLAIDTQTSNPTLNGGAGEGEVKFFDEIIVERQM